MNHIKSNLVVLTGYPCCGKTTLSKLLIKDMKFVLLSGDEIAVELFGHVYPFKENENPELIWKIICNRREELLKDGRNVVIDTTAYNDERRKVLLSTAIPSHKYLLWLKTDCEILNSRLRDRKWTKESIDKWKNTVKWEDPKSSTEYILLSFENNKKEDLNIIENYFKKY